MGIDLWWEADEVVWGSALGPMLRIVMGADVVHVTEFEAAASRRGSPRSRDGILIGLTTKCRCCFSPQPSSSEFAPF